MTLKQTKNIWFNNKLVPWEDATVHVLTYALHYGSAVFEGIRAYKTDDGCKIFRLDEHINRLIRGRQFIAAANFIDRLDSFPRDEMKIIIARTCKTVFIEMFNQDPSLYGQRYLYGGQ